MQIKNKTIYYTAILGAIALMVLRIFDKASLLSVVLVIVGMSAWIYSIRHACSKREYISMAVVLSFTFVVRFYGYTGVPITDILIGAWIGFVMFGIMGVECFFKKYKDSFLYTLIFPITYFMFMYFTELVKINMPFRLDTYFSCILVLCQITSVLGIYFLDFFLALTASSIVYFIDHKFSRQSIILAVCYVVLFGGVICFGFYHMQKMNLIETNKQNTIRVSCVSGPYVGNLSDGSYTLLSIDESVDSFTKIVKEAAKENTQILMFSEESYTVLDQDEKTLIHQAQKLASKYNMHILLAYEVTDTDDSEEGKGINKLCWISNEGKIIYEYIKHCIIPVIETSGYVRGDKNIEAFEIDVDGKKLKVATAICYDADFDSFMSHMGKNVDLLFLPTWDWSVIAEEHFSVSCLRAIQSETTLVRTAYDGWDAVIDSAGNVLNSDNTNDIGYENIIVYEVKVK